MDACPFSLLYLSGKGPIFIPEPTYFPMRFIMVARRTSSVTVAAVHSCQSVEEEMSRPGRDCGLSIDTDQFLHSKICQGEWSAISYRLGSNNYLLSNRIPNWSSLVAYHFASVIELFGSRPKQCTRNKNGRKPTSVIHRWRKHVETEQPIRIQVVQQSPSNICIKTVKITASRP